MTFSRNVLRGSMAQTSTFVNHCIGCAALSDRNRRMCKDMPEVTTVATVSSSEPRPPSNTAS